MVCEFLLLYILRKPFPAASTCLVDCLYHRNGWFSAGFLRPWLNISKGFSRPLDKGFSCPWLNISVVTSFFCLSIAPIEIIACSLYYSYYYYVYIIILSYLILYCSVNIIFLSSDTICLFFCSGSISMLK